MTIPIEKNYALENTRQFLRDLLDPKKTKRVPRVIREQAYRCLKHFPSPSDVQELAKKCPKIIGRRK